MVHKTYLLTTGEITIPSFLANSAGYDLLFFCYKKMCSPPQPSLDISFCVLVPKTLPSSSGQVLFTFLLGSLMNHTPTYLQFILFNMATFFKLFLLRCNLYAIKLYPFKVYNSVIFSIFTILKNHHHNLILEYLYYPPQKNWLRTNQQSLPIFSPPPAPSNH